MASSVKATLPKALKDLQRLSLEISSSLPSASSCQLSSSGHRLSFGPSSSSVIPLSLSRSSVARSAQLALEELEELGALGALLLG